MITLNELRTYLDQLLPSNGVKDYCPNGLQVEGKKEIRRIATAVSASIATIEAAVSEGVEALIVHHGLFWQGDREVVEGVKRRKLELLLKNDISLFGYHLPLDMHRLIGNNWKAAVDMGWIELQPFANMGGVLIGVKGKVFPCQREEFKNSLEKYYGHSAVCAWGGPKLIETVALVSGGAYKYITEAAQDKIDAFITGNFDEPAWHLAQEEKVNFFALGHSATERIGPLALAAHMQESLHLLCKFIDIENPF